MQIVAPAGSESGLRAAVNAGADAVYMGLPLFGARAKAENFSLDKLKQNIDYAHVFGAKVFITLNTLIKDKEMQTALDMAQFAYQSGADAAIVQDFRFIKKLKRLLPSFPLHASTQMGIHNAEGARVICDMGIKRAVLARETLPEDIVKIKDTGIEIEFFVQGALCVCFSGNCYFSSLASSYSGNRGKCMQLCRKPYTFNGRRGYFLSAKDICLYDRLDSLKSLGVDAIKIEGRMRSDEYVTQAVKIYKSNLRSDEAKDGLKSVFNRGDYCSAYLDKDAPFNVIYSKSQSNIGRSAGRIEKTDGKRIFVNGFTPHDGDGYKIMRSGVEIGGASARNGEIVSDGKCKAGDELRITFDSALSKELRAIERKIDVAVKVEISEGIPPSATLKEGTAVVKVNGDSLPQKALSSAITQNEVMRIFGKTGEFPFSPTVDVCLQDGLFMPVSQLNEFRRSAYKSLYDTLADKNAPKRIDMPEYDLDFNKYTGKGVMLMVESADQITPEIVSRVDHIVLNPRNYSDITVPKISKPVLLNAPITMRGNDVNIISKAISLDGISGIVSNNYYTLKLTDKPIIFGPGHNIIGDADIPHIKSYESDDASSGFIYVYGYAPLMTLCHCPYGKCVNCDGSDVLKDERGREFKLRRYTVGQHCYWQLLNCVPHDLTACIGSGNTDRFYDCTELSKQDILRVLDGEHPSDLYTRGNMNKDLK